MTRSAPCSLGALGLVVLLSAGCPRSSSSSAGSAGGAGDAAPALGPEEVARVEAACSRCHEAPRPRDLPRERWGSRILSMAGMPGRGDPPSKEELELALVHYSAQAPESLRALPQAERIDERVRFRRETFSPQSKRLLELRMPSVANVRFVHLSDPRRYDVLVSDMRISSLMLLMPWREGKGRHLRRLGRDLAYPVGARLADVNGDRRQDVIVPGHGAIQPGNHRKGRVTIMLQARGHRFANHVVADQLARPVDAVPGDLDGDGDLDLVVTAFGWRGPGRLLLLEHTSPKGTIRPSFATHELDPRDGWIHVGLADLDGDGRQDLVGLLAQEHEQVVAFLNRGGLRFEARPIYRAPTPAWGYSGLELVDLDGDGDLDVLASNGDTLDDDLLKPYHGVSWFENQGELRFAPHRIGSLYGCEAAAPADVDGDGDLDVVAVSFLPQLDPKVWRGRDLDSVVWFERAEEGRWVPHAIEKGHNYHPTVDAEDYDGDGKVDIVVGNFAWVDGGPGEKSRPRFEADYLTLFTQR